MDSSDSARQYRQYRRIRRQQRARRRQRTIQRTGPWIGACGLLVVLWLAIASSIFAPWWGVGVYILVLIIMAVRLNALARTRPGRCMWVPAYAIAAWLLITVAGTALGGWGP